MSGAGQFNNEKFSGLLVVAALLAALLVANSPLADEYAALLERKFSLGIAPLVLTKTLLHWINDGLMSVFFLLVGLEIKREVLIGELSSRDRALLPAIAAAGGMIAPALVYAGFNHGDAAALRGWPVPTATDIALALGVLSLIGRGLPPALRVFLLALAVIDDLGAIVLIAVLFTSELSWLSLGFAGLALAALAACNLAGVRGRAPYLLIGALMWLAVLKSGVHATLAGVATGLLVPLGKEKARDAAPLIKLEHGLQPWVALGIMPLFAFANAGLPLQGIDVAVLWQPVTLGIAFGLLVGKQLGVLGFTWLAVRLGAGALPPSVTWRHVYGLACLTGIGFTMSLFVGSLAFADDQHQLQVRLGVLIGSALSALCGFLWLRTTGGPSPASHLRIPRA